MPKAKRYILSTRPLPEALVEEAAAHDVRIEERSFIQIKPIIDNTLTLQIRELFQIPIIAVFTSANAVTAILEIYQKPKKWKVYTISNTTARQITELFKIPITRMAGNASLLADLIIKDGIKKVYFFCSNIRRDVLPDKLRKAGIVVEEIVVYETRETAVPMDRDYDGVLFFSPSSVHSFFSINKIEPATQLFAIGFTTAETIVHYTTNPVLIADRPDKEDLVRQMIQYFNAKKEDINE